MNAVDEAEAGAGAGAANGLRRETREKRGIGLALDGAGGRRLASDGAGEAR